MSFIYMSGASCLYVCDAILHFALISSILPRRYPCPGNLASVIDKLGTLTIELTIEVEKQVSTRFLFTPDISKNFFAQMSIQDQLNVLLHPRGPLTYEQVRFYLTEKGFTKPGKGMKHLIATIQGSQDPVTIVKDLKDCVDLMKSQKPEVARKKPGPKPGYKRKRAESTHVSEPEVGDDDGVINERLTEALAIRGKTQHGTLMRRVKRLLDALDEEDAEEDDPVFEKDDDKSSDHENDLFGPDDD